MIPTQENLKNTPEPVYSLLVYLVATLFSVKEFLDEDDCDLLENLTKNL